MTDSSNVMRLVQEIAPDEIYNLAAQSHVQVSFETAEYTANVDAFGARCGFWKPSVHWGCKTKHVFIRRRLPNFMAKRKPCHKTKPHHFIPVHPMAWRSLRLLDQCQLREAYGIHASNSILFNHESPMRGETFL